MASHHRPSCSHGTHRQVAQQDGGRAVAVVVGCRHRSHRHRAAAKEVAVCRSHVPDPPRLQRRRPRRYRAARRGVDNCRSAVQRNALPLPLRLEPLCWRRVEPRVGVLAWREAGVVALTQWLVTRMTTTPSQRDRSEERGGGRALLSIAIALVNTTRQYPPCGVQDMSICSLAATVGHGDTVSNRTCSAMAHLAAT